MSKEKKDERIKDRTADCGYQYADGDGYRECPRYGRMCEFTPAALRNGAAGGGKDVRTLCERMGRVLARSITPILLAGNTVRVIFSAHDMCNTGPAVGPEGGRCTACDPTVEPKGWGWLVGHEGDETLKCSKCGAEVPNKRPAPGKPKEPAKD